MLSLDDLMVEWDAACEGKPWALSLCWWALPPQIFRAVPAMSEIQGSWASKSGNFTYTFVCGNFLGRRPNLICSHSYVVV